MDKFLYSKSEGQGLPGLRVRRRGRDDPHAAIERAVEFLIGVHVERWIPPRSVKFSLFDLSPRPKDACHPFHGRLGAVLASPHAPEGHLSGPKCLLSHSGPGCHQEGRSGAEDGGAVDAPGPLARVDGGAPVVTIPARQARAFRVIDNRTSELTSWDTDLLPDALSGLNDLDIFSFDDVLPLAVTAGKTDPDDIPETPKNPVSRVGDIWTLGKHRLMCGDATKPRASSTPSRSSPPTLT